MSIYTKTGDKGTTSVSGGRRVSKSDLQINACGSVDELSSFIGLIIAKTKDAKEKKLLTEIQKKLYDIMAYLGGWKIELKDLEKDVLNFEKEIDNITKKLPELRRFILPQGPELASLYHIVRSVCRRAERTVVEFFNHSKMSGQNVDFSLKYLNRFSDLLFVLARKSSRGQEVVT